MEQRVLTPEEMRRCDKHTIETKRISEFDLMEAAARAIYEEMEAMGLLEDPGRITILAGPGNNGGDGFGLARHLLADGLEVVCVLLGDKKGMSEAARKMLDGVLAETAAFEHIAASADLDRLETVLAESGLIVDALFGIGLNGPIRGIAAAAVEHINKTAAVVVSLDVPSGLNAYNGLAEGAAVHADHTIVIQTLKTGNLLADALDHQGESRIVDAGILMAPTVPNRRLLDEKSFRNYLPRRRHHSHKYTYGSVLALGGGPSMEGAVVLAAEAALRSGTGLATIVRVASAGPSRIHTLSEIMVSAYETLADLEPLLRKKTALVYGMGMGKGNPEESAILNELLKRGVPMVVDADGLRILKGIHKGPTDLESTVLTPHIGELAAFFAVDTNEVLRDPIDYVMRLVDRTRATIVLKGPGTIIAAKDRQYFSVLGNPGMATAGSGDVLSGVIGRFLGAGYAPPLAAALGVYAHALAGGFAKEHFGEEGMVASDIIAFLPEALAIMAA